LLAEALRDPVATAALDAAGWAALLTMARAELLLDALAYRLGNLPVPGDAGAILADARGAAEQQRRTALWEAEAVRRALAPLGVPMMLLKGTAYAAAGLLAGRGRSVGDCDILVPRGVLDAVEAALLGAGWEWVKPDAYDDAYYRRWMHELPPLIHRERNRMVDVHHTILPLTARPKPDVASLIADAVPLGNGMSVLSPADMIVHSAAHLFADGDLAGGLRNLWDIRCLLEEFGTDGLEARAERHGLRLAVSRAVRHAHALFDAPGLDSWMKPETGDALFRRRLLARDGWGRAIRPVTRVGFYARSHLLRMPPVMLARHLWIKWRKAAPA
jgi:hypothetical protein